MIWLPLLVKGSVLYAGGKALQRVKKRLLRRRTEAISPAVQTSDRELTVSVVSLSAAAAGGWWAIPVLGWLSVPVTLYLFVPVMRDAGQTLRKEHRVNDHVLTTTRLAVCVVMGYTFIAALDAGLHTFSHWLKVHNENDWRAMVQQRFGTASPQVVAWLEQVAQQPTATQSLGEGIGARVAPFMLATCVLTTPALGINRSAAFLTTFFGSHLRTLGSYTAQKFMSHALQHDIVVMHPQLLDQALRVDTIVLDGRLLHDSTALEQFNAILPSLHQRQVYVLTSDVEADEDTTALHDGCQTLAAHDGLALIQQWQANGQRVCYVGNGVDDAPIRQAVNLAVLCCAALPPDMLEKPAPQVLLLGGDLRTLLTVFALAETFAQRQQFNLLAPMGVDLVDISTTLFLDFGLVYSVMFTYTGLLLGMSNAPLDSKTVNP